MKKPDIAKGEWVFFVDKEEYKRNGRFAFVIASDEAKKFGFLFAQKEEDAKAVIAVPEMIDALIQAKETIRTWHGEGAWDLYQHSPEMTKINNALKKAGVEL